MVKTISALKRAKNSPPSPIKASSKKSSIVPISDILDEDQTKHVRLDSGVSEGGLCVLVV